jgi:hypothetical protein
MQAVPIRTSQLSVEDPLQDPIATGRSKASRWSENTGKTER